MTDILLEAVKVCQVGYWGLRVYNECDFTSEVSKKLMKCNAF